MDKHGRTALLLACVGLHFDLAKISVESGADVSERSDRRKLHVFLGELYIRAWERGTSPLLDFVRMPVRMKDEGSMRFLSDLTGGGRSLAVVGFRRFSSCFAIIPPTAPLSEDGKLKHGTSLLPRVLSGGRTLEVTDMSMEERC